MSHTCDACFFQLVTVGGVDRKCLNEKKSKNDFGKDCPYFESIYLGLNMPCIEEFERFINDLESGDVFGAKYLDNWSMEEEYSHSELDTARWQFIKKVNKWLANQNLPYKVRIVCDNIMLCDPDGSIIRK